MKRYLVYLTLYTLLISSGSFILGRLSLEMRPFEQSRRDFFKHRIVHELALSGPQIQQLDVILEKYRPRIQQHRHEIRSQMEADILLILTPEQKKQFESLKKRHQNSR